VKFKGIKIGAGRGLDLKVKFQVVAITTEGIVKSPQDTRVLNPEIKVGLP
jgi:hypothetical protein